MNMNQRKDQRGMNGSGYRNENENENENEHDGMRLGPA